MCGPYVRIFIHPFADENGTYIGPYVIAGDHPLTPEITRPRKALLFRTEENPIFLPSGGSDEHGHTVRVNPIPHRGEQRKDTVCGDRPVSCQLSWDFTEDPR